ncbi:TonB-dependent receptor [Pseudoflavitalea sp. G-6-1-2]|uniref:TonB-dependent receptor domain-containing protein n=1 Tax=Pseudoflavitalea sp. G-6-1-2 TaxID=2728841 RepID=UPI00146C9CE1|nr:TonB-dependent receptor [Pseudoflavitalea sp. G-6-1-2]NML22308.1 TonB-dependent receptor [Pseudoflavitalea sp. G-6-1-2]
MRIVFYFLPILCCITLNANAQNGQKVNYRLSSRIIDSVSQKPLANVSILLLNEKQQTVYSGSSGHDGHISIPVSETGLRTLVLTAIGYQKTEITFAVNNSQEPVLPETIALSTIAVSLAEVTVSSRKKLIESKPGKLIYNAGNDATNKGGTAADVLRKAPVLNVDAKGNVSMRGSKKIKILVNGKYSGQMARNAADALNMMPADLIQSVEVITTPSAKYDAEGAAGVINIITKKGKKSFNGALELSGSNMEQVINPRVGFSNGKWNVMANGHLHRLRIKESSLLDRTQIENGKDDLNLWQEMQSDNVAPHGSGDLAITFTPDSVSEFSFGANTWFGKWPTDRKQQTIVRDVAGNSIEHYFQDARSRENYFGGDINLSYSRKFKKTGQELTILTQFSPSKSRNPYHIWQSAQKDGSYNYEEFNGNDTRNTEWTLQTDYTHPILDDDRLTIETGVKAIFRNVQNNYHVLAGDPQSDAGLQPIASRTDEFKYRQDVLAAYALIKSNLDANWYAEAGLRVERTDLHGEFRDQKNPFGSQFTNFVPNATITRKFNDEQQLSFSYTQRLTRPYIWDLNSNLDASDPKNQYQGNPALKPETMHQAELVYGWNKGSEFFLNTSFFWKLTDNSIVDYTETNAEGISKVSKQNLAAYKLYGVNLSSSATLNSWWTLNGNVNINNIDYSSNALHILNRGWAADFDLNVSFKLPKRYTIQAFGQYTTRDITLQGHDSYQYSYTFSVKKELQKPKLSFTATAINPFSEYIPQTIYTAAANFRSDVGYRYYLRQFRLTVNWEFGNMFKAKEKKKIENDDVRSRSKGA